MNLLTQAIYTENLNRAIAPIQNALGITDGGIAGQTLDQAQWEQAHPFKRKDMLSNWLWNEILMAYSGETALAS
jgi:hypothetical protein